MVHDLSQPRDALKITRGLSSAALKIIGCILMVFDHVHQMFYMKGAPLWFTMIGRLVGPIFLFACAEGFSHTRSKGKYMLRLYIGYLIMRIMTYLIMPRFFYVEDVELMNNIFQTMFLATVYMWAWDKIVHGFRQRSAKPILLGLLAAILPIVSFFAMMLPPPFSMYSIYCVPMLLATEGSFVYVVLALAFYILRRNRLLQVGALLACGAFTLYNNLTDGASAMPLVILGVIIAALTLARKNEYALRLVIGLTLAATIAAAVIFRADAFGEKYAWMMTLAAIPILAYNGTRGMKLKYFFYIFYPAHIYGLYILAWFLNGGNPA